MLYWTININTRSTHDFCVADYSTFEFYNTLHIQGGIERITMVKICEPVYEMKNEEKFFIEADKYVTTQEYKAWEKLREILLAQNLWHNIWIPNGLCTNHCENSMALNISRTHSNLALASCLLHINVGVTPRENHIIMIYLLVIFTYFCIFWL